MGPLTGTRVIEMGGIGPGPFAAMMLADMGADVLRIERPGGLTPFPEPRFDVMRRGRRSVSLDLKDDRGVATVLELVERADALIEGFRPGAMEELGLGPDACLERNPKLVYGRITGWGQHGPLAGDAGHDIDFIALSGALHSFGGRGSKPAPPLNLVGDFGGGGMLLAFGVVCALLEAARSGRGQVVDAAMVDGSALLMALIYGMRACGLWSDSRGVNLLDGGAHFYDTYETADGRWLAVGAIEPGFYAELLQHAGIDDPDFANQFDPARWSELGDRLAAVFKRKTRDEWCAVFEGTDACVAPVLSMAEAPTHRHNEARRTFIEIDGVVQPGPAPRFSRTPGEVSGPPRAAGADTETALRDWGLDERTIDSLRRAGVIPATSPPGA